MASNVTKNETIVDFHYEETGTGKNGAMTAEEKFVVAPFRKEIVVTSESGASLSLFDWALLMAKNIKEINYDYQTHGMAESDIERGRKTF